MQDKSPTIAPWLRTRARGAVSNVAGRYEVHEREVFHDGWEIEEEARGVATEVRFERPRSAITRNSSPDIGFDRSINPYRGCEHGCIYCFARTTHAFLGMSPGLDFETRLIARPGIAAVLARELAARRYRVAPIAIGTNTDPYQPVEARLGLMREVLEVLLAHRHPVTITTKGTLIERDLNLLQALAAEGLVSVGISVTTMDPATSRAMEPRAPLPARRFEVMRRLTAVGVPVHAMVAPIVPGLTDHEVEAIVAAAAMAGAGSAGWIMLRLPGEVADLFKDWLEQHFPDRAARILARVRALHGGKDYDPAWVQRMTGTGSWAEMIRKRFEISARRNGLSRKPADLRRDLFRVPPKPGDQLSLF